MFEKRRPHDHCSAARMRFSLQEQHVQQLIKNHGGAASARETQGSVTNRDLVQQTELFLACLSYVSFVVWLTYGWSPVYEIRRRQNQSCRKRQEDFASGLSFNAGRFNMRS